jgi:hypothetical protein
LLGESPLLAAAGVSLTVSILILAWKVILLKSEANQILYKMKVIQQRLDWVQTKLAEQEYGSQRIKKDRPEGYYRD